MSLLRAHLLHHRRLAMVLVALTLAIKALIPEGYMPDFGARTITVEICADAFGQPAVRAITLARAGDGDGAGQHDTSHHGKGEGFCAFSALGHGTLGGADAVLLAGALLFIMALAFAAPVPPVLRRLTFLRPPLRGPPALA
jgi:hypothetical protein